MRAFTLLLTALALAPLSARALDLTPSRGFRELEGFRIPIVLFPDGEQKVSYQPPAKWRVAGGGQFLELYPEDRPEVQTQFRLIETRLGDPKVENLEAWCRQFLPKDAEKAVLDGETVSPFTLRALPSREFTYTYVTQNRRFTTSIAVVDLSPQERLSVITTARMADFKAAREEVIRSLYSMTWGS